MPWPNRCETVARGHGRLERRTCTILGGPHGILEEIDPDQRWAGLGCAVRRVAERTVCGCTTRAVRHCITNLPVTAICTTSSCGPSTPVCASGKPRTVELDAAMCKLLLILNAVLRDQVPWQLNRMPASDEA